VQRDALLGEPGLGAVQLQRLVGALQVGLGQRRALVGQQRLLADQVHAGAQAGGGQAAAQLRGGMAAADDHDRWVHGQDCRSVPASPAPRWPGGWHRALAGPWC
jgi:hypothetical protein